MVIHHSLQGMTGIIELSVKSGIIELSVKSGIIELSVKSVPKRKLSTNSVQTHGKTESHLFLGKNEFCLSFPTS